MSERRMRFPVYARISAVAARKQFVSLALVVMVALLASAPASWAYLCAWGEIYVFDGQNPDDYSGNSVSGAGDVDNDGYADFIVGAYGNDAGGSGAGRAYVYSGQTGGLLWTFTGEAAGDEFGKSVSGAGDLDNDGYDDVIVGAYHNDAGGTHAGRAYVYSGQTGGLLWTFTGEAADDWPGTSVSGAGDGNDDGHADLIVGASGNDAGGSRAGRAYVYSGQTGALIWTFTGEAADDFLGTSVSGAGDVNDDGYDDVVVGASGNDAGGSSGGRAYVYSGQTGGLLWTFTGGTLYSLGASVSGAGDVNDDGYADLIVGAYGAASSDGRAYVYSGQTGGVLWTFQGETENENLGWSVSGAGDVDGDGYDDLIAGAWQSDAEGDGAGRAYVYSGQTGAKLHTFTGEAIQDFLGNSVSGAGDVNGDGRHDLIVGAYRNDAGGTDAGRAYVFSGRTDVLCFAGEAGGDWFGWSVSGAGDVNNDGYDDVTIGAPRWLAGLGPGRACVHSGDGGSLLWTYTGEAQGDALGYSVSGAGDVNNDGYDDFIAGAPSNDWAGSAAGRAYVYSGQTGSVLWTFTGEGEYDYFGVSVSGAGDVNDDGYDDLIVGAARDRIGDSWAEPGRAYVYSGQTGGLLHTFTAEATGDWFGWSVSGAGDVNNDGYDDLIVGAPNNQTGNPSGGRAYVYSGPSGNILWTFDGDPLDHIGYSVCGAGDVNMDGHDDLVVGAPWSNAGGVDAGLAYVYCGQTGSVLRTFMGEMDDDELGSSVSGAGDVNGDGYADLIVGAPGNDAGGPDAGRAYVYSGQTGGLLCTFEGESDGSELGMSVSGAGDLDKDGFYEVIVGAPHTDAAGTHSGRAYVFSCQAEEAYVPGDANGDETVNVADVVYLVNFLYRSGASPDPMEAGDANSDDIVNVADVVYLVNYLYRGGDPPIH